MSTEIRLWAQAECLLNGRKSRNIIGGIDISAACHTGQKGNRVFVGVHAVLHTGPARRAEGQDLTIVSQQ